MRALATDGAGGFTARNVPDPIVADGQILVRVHAASVGPRDLRMGQQRAGLCPGSDFAGVVEQSTGRSGPQPGDRVVGVIPMGAWSERVSVNPRSVCRLPDAIEFADAAAVAATGLTALYALERAPSLIGRSVLITGAGGAVGRLVCQLAELGGAQATAWVRSKTAAARLGDIGAIVACGASVAVASGDGPFALIVDVVGGAALAGALNLLAVGGKLVSVGAAEGGTSVIDAAALYRSGHEIIGFGLFPELEAKPARDGLARLLPLLANRRIIGPDTVVHAAFGPHPTPPDGRRLVLAFA